MLPTIAEIFLIFIIPVALIYYKVVSFSKRFWILGIFFCFTFAIILNRNWSFMKLGVRFDNLRSAFFPYVIFTILGLIFLVFLSRLVHGALSSWQFKRLQILISIPVSIAQEFIYRGFLMSKLEEIIPISVFVILINAILFAFLHIIYPHKKFNLVMYFIAGIGFASLYYWFPNLILISVSHIVLNLAATSFGFFTLTTQETVALSPETKTSYLKKLFLKFYID